MKPRPPRTRPGGTSGPPGRPCAKAARCCLVLALLCVWLQAAAARADDALPWLSYDQALRAGQDNARPVLVFYYTPWCHLCKKMRRLVFGDPEVARLMRRAFVLVQVDAAAQPRLAELNGVNAVPTIQLLDSHGRLTRVLRGYALREVFLAELRRAARGAAAPPPPPGPAQ